MITPKNPKRQKQWTPERRALQAEIARRVNAQKKQRGVPDQQRSGRA